MKKLFLISFVIILVGALVLGGCTQPAPSPEPSPTPSPTPTPAPAEPIKIGCLAPLTGPFAMWGKWFTQAFDLALEEANYEFGGRPIEWLLEDEGGADVGMALDKAKKLVEADKIDIMIGPFYGGSHFSVFCRIRRIRRPISMPSGQSAWLRKRIRSAPPGQAFIRPHGCIIRSAMDCSSIFSPG